MTISARFGVSAGMEPGSFHVPRSLTSKSFWAMYWTRQAVDQTRDRAFGRGDAYVVVTVEQNQENADGGREQKQPILREHIRVQQTPTVAHADLVLFLLVDAIEWCKIDIGGGLVDVDVIVRCAEDAENKQELVTA